MKAAIFTGSRHWASRDEGDPTHQARNIRLNELEFNLAQDVLAGFNRGDIVIHGDCETGLDSLVVEALGEPESEATEVPMPAQWEAYRRAKDLKAHWAGPTRNKEMLRVLLALKNCGYDVSVHAFPLPDSRGTWDMVKKAKAKGVYVVVHEP